MSFTCLKAFAYDQRSEPKDAHDLVYCVEHYEGGLDAVHAAFRAARHAGDRLVILAADGQGAKRITAEGLAVLLMLNATRRSPVRQRRPSHATIRAPTEVGLGLEPREERLTRVEREAARWDAAFLRSDEAGGRPSSS